MDVLSIYFRYPTFVKVVGDVLVSWLLNMQQKPSRPGFSWNCSVQTYSHPSSSLPFLKVIFITAASVLHNGLFMEDRMLQHGLSECAPPLSGLRPPHPSPRSNRFGSLAEVEQMAPVLPQVFSLAFMLSLSGTLATASWHRVVARFTCTVDGIPQLPVISHSRLLPVLTL